MFACLHSSIQTYNLGVYNTWKEKEILSALRGYVVSNDKNKSKMYAAIYIPIAFSQV